MKPYYFSHSSVDKPLVRAVADALGPDLVWLDAWDLNPGDELFRNIDAALGSVRIVAVYWSAASKASAWVREEVSFARYRSLQGEDVRVVPIRLDSTPLPHWMDRLLWIDGKGSPKEIAGKLKTLLPEDVLTEKGERDPSFQNRTQEADFFEGAYKSTDISGVLLLGLPGIGKTAFTRHVLENRLPHLRTIWLDLDRLNTPALAFGALAGRIGLRLTDEIVSRGEWELFWRSAVFPSLTKQRDVIVLDGLSAISEDSKLPDWCQSMIRDLSESPTSESLPIVLVSTGVVDLPPKAEGSLRRLHLGSLDDSDIERIIRYRLANTYPKRTPSAEHLSRAARIVHGYPLAAQLWAAHASTVSVEVALADKGPMERQIRDVVADVLSQAKLDKMTRDVLVVVAVVRIPLPAREFIEGLAVDASALSNLQRTCFFDPRTSGIAVHQLVAKYILESIASHQDVRAAHGRVGLYFKRRWQSSPADRLTSEAILAGSQAYFHLVSAGRADEASVIGWALQDEARSAVRELYRTGDYDPIIAVAEALSSLSDHGSPRAQDETVLFYYGLAVGRRNEGEADRIRCKEVFKNLFHLNPSNRHYRTGLGSILARWNDNEGAKDQFRQARSLANRTDPVPSMLLGELLLREGNITDAEYFIKEARTRAPADLQVLSAYAHLLDAKGERQEALALVREGLRRRPDDIALNHRAGLLLRQMGRSQDAVGHLSMAAKGRLSLASYTALADLFLELGRVADAKRVIKEYPGKYGASVYNVLGHIARREQKLDDAEHNFRKCLEIEGDTVVALGSLAQLYLDRARAELKIGLVERARAHLTQADEAIVKGLGRDEENDDLLRLRRDCDGLRLQALQGNARK